MKENEKLKKGETKEMRKQNLNKGSHTSHFPHPTSQNGITLIALVITIIVMLILVAVSVSAAINGGLFGYAKNAVDETDSAKDAEQSLARGQVTIGNKTYETIDEYLNGENSKWDSILAEANANPDAYKHPEQLVSAYIAIGTDGEPVNMDYWNPSKHTDGTWTLGDGYHYADKNVYTEDCDETGRIKGTVPQYIYNEELGSFKEVTSMYATFGSRTDLVYAPKIPDTVTSMVSTFNYCTSLTEAPEIPNSVTYMAYTFSDCTSLTEAPEIPNGVTDMSYTFSDCTSLTEAPEIPNGVTNMSNTFSGCTSLTEAPEIPNGVTNMSSTFSDCTSLTEAPEIPNSVTNMHYTFYNCTNLTEALEIPNNVRNMNSTFSNCTSLTGTITINANPTIYTDCFKGTVKPITLTASSTETETATATTLNNLKGTANKWNVSIAQ